MSKIQGLLEKYFENSAVPRGYFPDFTYLEPAETIKVLNMRDVPTDQRGLDEGILYQGEGVAPIEQFSAEGPEQTGESVLAYPLP